MKKLKPKIHHIDELRPSTVSEVICVKCLRRWIAVYLTGTYLKDLHCPNCGPGFVINTGEIIKETNLEEI